MKTSNDFSRVFEYSSTYGQGWLRATNNGSVVATALRSVRSVREDRSRGFIDTFHPAGSQLKKLGLVSSEVPKAVLTDVSPSGQYSVGFQNNSFGTKDEKPYVEVSSEAESYRVDLSSTHGSIMGDAFFSGCSWSSDERFVAYVAMKKNEKSTTYFTSDNGKSESNKFDFVEDWGEKYEGVSSTRLFILDLKERRVIPISDVDETVWCVGQPCIVTTSSSSANSSDKQYILLYTAWNVQPRRLGLIYCYQRPCKLFAVLLTSTSTATATAAKSAGTAADSNSASAASALKHRMLTDTLQLARSARCSSDGEIVVFLGSEAGFRSHNGCSELFTVSTQDLLRWCSSPADVSSKSLIRKVVAEVANSWNGHEMLFPGIFTGQLPSRCFLSNNTVLLNSVWGSSDAILCVNLTSGEVTRVYCNPAHRGSESLLDVCGADHILYTRTSPTQPVILGIKNLVTGECSETRGGMRHAVNAVDGSTAAAAAAAGVASAATSNNAAPAIGASAAGSSTATASASLDLEEELEWSVLHHHADGIPFESILIAPRINTSATSTAATTADATDVTTGSTTSTSVASSLPLIVVPHGGPHSVFTTDFTPCYAFLAYSLQAAVLLVNYRGSVGFGQASVASLMGNVGSNDVADVMTAVFAVQGLKRSDSDVSLVDSSKIAVVGGSHGGFLAGHLIGQHPEVFRSACMRNPVTNISTMHSVSDIPDWCCIEALGDTPAAYDFNAIKCPTEEEIIVMRRKSPVAHYHKVTAAVLLCFGLKDRRVPPSQGIEYYHLLKSRNISVKMLTFPEDTHAIDKPASEADHWVAIAEWIQSHW